MDFRQFQNISWAQASRETRLLIVTGKKRIGKSKVTLEYLENKYIKGNIAKGIKPRKGLIFDVNDEYTHIKAIFPEHIPAFNVHPTCEIVRIRPLLKDKMGKAYIMNNTEKIKMLAYILKVYKGGALLIEDINKYAVHAMPDDVMGPLCANAHTDCDIIMHYQTTNRPLPMVWENTGVIRFHFQHDDVWGSQEKLGEHIEIFKIAQTIVNTEYYKNNNERFYLWIDKDQGKIIGNFDSQKFQSAILEYVTSKRSILTPFLNRIDLNGNKLYTPAQAIQELQKQLYRQYWGND